jgi:hypothetical protein
MIPLKLKNNKNSINKEANLLSRAASSKKANITIFSAIILTAVLCFFVFVYPGAVNARNTSVKLARLEADIKYKTGLSESLSELVSKYRRDLKTAEGMIFTDKDIATFLNNFSDFVTQANMTLISLRKMRVSAVPYEKPAQRPQARNVSATGQAQKDAESELPGLLMQPMQVKLKGEYPELINFLISLEQYKQLLTISNLDISISREGYPMLEAGFTLRLYTMDAPENAPDKEPRT